MDSPASTEVNRGEIWHHKRNINNIRAWPMYWNINIRVWHHKTNINNIRTGLCIMDFFLKQSSYSFIKNAYLQ